MDSIEEGLPPIMTEKRCKGKVLLAKAGITEAVSNKKKTIAEILAVKVLTNACKNEKA